MVISTTKTYTTLTSYQNILSWRKQVVRIVGKQLHLSPKYMGLHSGCREGQDSQRVDRQYWYLKVIKFILTSTYIGINLMWSRKVGVKWEWLKWGKLAEANMSMVGQMTVGKKIILGVNPISHMIINSQATSSLTICIIMDFIWRQLAEGID